MWIISGQLNWNLLFISAHPVYYIVLILKLVMFYSIAVVLHSSHWLFDTIFSFPLIEVSSVTAKCCDCWFGWSFSFRNAWNFEVTCFTLQPLFGLDGSVREWNFRWSIDRFVSICFVGISDPMTQLIVVEMALVHSQSLRDVSRVHVMFASQKITFQGGRVGNYECEWRRHWCCARF